MKIVLLGYMSSGKSSVGKELAKHLQIQFVDLDHYIETKLQMNISEIFQQKGEIFFRKIENECLKEVLDNSEHENLVLALGGGTPCYYNNMELINQQENTTSFYLKQNIQTLLERLWEEKESRPLISHYQDLFGLEEFIRKHLFERQFFYLQAKHIVEVSNLNMTQIIETINLKMNNK
ncbi:shikimate kinase [Psychroflexus planctonicus]|uniref:Shikimate kinase n=1 Tax=Psychroflexus planctonicus TaxID=1526575 RepID=A0ABQ1SLV0_9FLAO|nr:shikimate kinase [Psychroflexus planctonicus]GGE42833.1 shikimate kinase [Psychroflexus planctonicus]